MVITFALVWAAVAATVAAQQASPLPPLPADMPGHARVYTQLTADRPGRMVAWTDPDGTIQVIHQHANPDGCLTDVRSIIVIDAGGVPIRLEHTGRSCEPARAVSERYYRVGSAGRWHTAAGDGEGDTAGKKFYVSLTAVPEERALLARALLAAGGALPLLPAGEARLERMRELTVRAGDRTESVTHYRVHGLGAEPISIWLDGRGELFALQLTLIRQGWEAVVPILRAGPPSLAVDRGELWRGRLRRRSPWTVASSGTAGRRTL